jgi:pyridoxine kinase
VLNQCEAVLSGYLGDGAVGRAIVNAVKKVREKSPNSLYCCDPVMGDAGRGFYVKPDIPDMFKKELVPLADIITPNQFELEALTGIRITNIKDALQAINILHETGPSIILVTSFLEKEGELSMIASDKTQVFKITTPQLPLGDGVAGTGDMTAAVFLSRYLETKNLAKTLEMCTASIFGILEFSSKAFSHEKNTRLELKIINAQEHFTAPSHCFKPEKII